MLNLNNTMDLRRWFVTAALVMLVLVAGTGTVLAGHHTDAVASYTGCLTKGGAVTEVAVGDVPRQPCGPDHTEVHLSGGDITAVAAGDGLTGGASDGAATLALAPSHQLPQTCTNAQVVKWGGTAWGCAADDAGQQYSAGTGLELHGTEFSLDRDYRLPQGCEAGQAAGFGPTATSLGDWRCSQYALANETCPSGQFARATDDDGALLCAAPTTSGSSALQALSAAQPTFDTGMGLPDDGNYRVVASIAAPAGTYLVTAKGAMRTNGDINDFSDASDCRIVGGVELDRIAFVKGDLDGEEWEETFSLNGVGTTTGGPLALECRAGIGADGLSVYYGRIVALKIG